MTEIDEIIQKLQRKMYGQIPEVVMSVLQKDIAVLIDAVQTPEKKTSIPKTVVAIKGDGGETSRLASALKMWLAFSGMSQRDLAKALECSPSTITRFMDGKEMDAATTLRLFQWMLGKS